jgi:Recombination endonuclease VII
MTKAAKREYDKGRYAYIRASRLRQMRSYRRKNRVRLNKMEAARRARKAKTINAAKRKAYAANPAKYLAANRRRRYKFTIPPAPRRCECCGGRTRRKLHVDHCHQSNRFRGWLCSKCNTGIGLLGDNLRGVMRAIKYLRRKK